MTPKALNHLSREVIGAAIAVHQHLGPGLLESVYEACLGLEIGERGFAVRAQVAVPVTYKDRPVSHEGFRIDLLVEEELILEIKSVEALKAVHKKQLLTYLRLAQKRLGLLINFNEPVLKRGMVRVVNGLEDEV